MCQISPMTISISISLFVRSNYKNGNNLLAHALTNFNWPTLESFDNMDLKVAFFDHCFLTLLIPLYLFVLLQYITVSTTNPGLSTNSAVWSAVGNMRRPAEIVLNIVCYGIMSTNFPSSFSAVLQQTSSKFTCIKPTKLMTRDEEADWSSSKTSTDGDTQLLADLINWIIEASVAWLFSTLSSRDHCQYWWHDLSVRRRAIRSIQLTLTYQQSHIRRTTWHSELVPPGFHHYRSHYSSCLQLIY